jgi:pilus assembly protein CpaE
MIVRNHLSPITAQTVSVLVMTDSEETAVSLSAIVAEHPGLVPQWTLLDGAGQVAAQAKRFTPDVVVIADTTLDIADLVEKLDRGMPEAPAVVVLPDGDFDLAQRCTLNGARATLSESAAMTHLGEAIRRVHEREVARRRPELVERVSGPKGPAKVIAVHGGKGGVGATTVACNLAAALQRVTGGRVALVDGDVLSGATAVLLDLAPIRSVSDLVQTERRYGRHLKPVRDVSDLVPDAKRVDASALTDVMVRHRSGLDVLLAPEQLQDAEALGGEDMQRVLGMLKEHYDLIVVDTSSNLTPITLAAMDEADKVVLVVTPELVPLRNAARFLQLASRIGYAPEKVELVINRADSKSEISSAVMEDLLRREIAMALPSDGQTLVKCLNSGELVVLAQPKHPIAQAITKLARSLAQAVGLPVPGAQETGRGGFFWRKQSAPAPRASRSPLRALGVAIATMTQRSGTGLAA